MQEAHYLTPLLEPRSIAVIGASPRPESVGGVILRNIREAGFRGAIHPVNPKYAEIDGLPACPDAASLPEAVDLAVIATPAASVPQVIDACGRRGVRAATVVSAGFAESGPAGAVLERQAVEAARRHGLRLLGPNCLGVIRPRSGLNATFAKGSADPGNLALISQSGALCTAILDWARPNNVGFSAVVSLGSSADVDFGEILDYLIYDRQTESILLYIEGIRNARRFMSALRSAARIKPIILLKVGRHASGLQAVQSHTGALVGSDAAFDAAVQRSGAVRVATIGQLFGAAQALCTRFAPSGNRLAILTNGGGPGVMAADRAADLNVELAQFAPETVAGLNAALPSTWSRNNPVDIVGDADAERYRTALELCLKDPHVDGALVMLTPQAMTPPLAIARSVIELARAFRKPLVTCWMGEEQVAESRQLFAREHIPTFRTPEPAVELFSHISAFYRNQRLLLQTPAPRAQEAPSEPEGARLLIEAVLAERRALLSEMESKAVLREFGVPVAQAMLARSPTEALLLAEQVGLPVAMKIDSPDITHKTEAGGVRLNIATAQGVRTAYQEILDTVRRTRPDARINGVAIEPHVQRPNGREVMIGVTRDPVFGPVISFGAGGGEVEVRGDRALALPPLNAYLAQELMRGTRVFRTLEAFRHMPPADLAAIERVLLAVSELVCELPWVEELDINPLIVDEHGAIAADARILVAPQLPQAGRYAHMAIHPYPARFVERWQLPDGTPVTIRPIRPEDAEMVKAFVRDMSQETRYFRFMDTLRELSQTMLVRFTQIDYDREMALIAVVGEPGHETEIGVARYVTNPDGETCEFAIAIGDAWQQHGVGHKLMSSLIAVARQRGFRAIVGDVLAVNPRMLRLMDNLGFEIAAHPQDPTVRKVTLRLDAP